MHVEHDGGRRSDGRKQLLKRAEAALLVEMPGGDHVHLDLLADRQGEQGLVSLDAVLDRREDVCLQGVGQLVEVREQVLGQRQVGLQHCGRVLFLQPLLRRLFHLLHVLIAAGPLPPRLDLVFLCLAGASSGPPFAGGRSSLVPYQGLQALRRHGGQWRLPEGRAVLDVPVGECEAVGELAQGVLDRGVLVRGRALAFPPIRVVRLALLDLAVGLHVPVVVPRPPRPHAPVVAEVVLEVGRVIEGGARLVGEARARDAALAHLSASF